MCGIRGKDLGAWKGDLCVVVCQLSHDGQQSAGYMNMDMGRLAGSVSAWFGQAHHGEAGLKDPAFGGAGPRSLPELSLSGQQSNPRRVSENQRSIREDFSQ